jgi:hypothetical protein
MPRGQGGPRHKRQSADAAGAALAVEEHLVTAELHGPPTLGGISRRTRKHLMYYVMSRWASSEVSWLDVVSSSFGEALVSERLTGGKLQCATVRRGSVAVIAARAAVER